MKDFFHHIFLPKESNNHRPKILHNKSILFIILVFFISQIFILTLKSNFSEILGTSTNISSQDLLLLTNQDRVKAGLSPLVLNDRLSEAASLKASDMLEKNYWAHSSPEGTTPWFFIKRAGYEYTFAGENLARGFSSSQDVINAWMASSSHRENILSSNYKDIGFAVVQGKLKGEDGVLVVEMFGSKGAPPLAKQTQNQEVKAQQTVSKPSTLTAKVQTQPVMVASVKATPIVDINALSKSLGIIALALFISVFILDMVIIERKKIVRLVGHNLDHVLFLTGILILVIIITRGVII